MHQYEARNQVTAALLQLDPTYPELYVTSPEFKLAVDTMVRMAPDMLEIAAHRELDPEARARFIKIVGGGDDLSAAHARRMEQQ